MPRLKSYVQVTQVPMPIYTLANWCVPCLIRRPVLLTATTRPSWSTMPVKVLQVLVANSSGHNASGNPKDFHKPFTGFVTHHNIPSYIIDFYLSARLPLRMKNDILLAEGRPIQKWFARGSIPLCSGLLPERWFTYLTIIMTCHLILFVIIGAYMIWYMYKYIKPGYRWNISKWF